jgi:hypothetical protein
MESGQDFKTCEEWAMSIVHYWEEDTDEVSFFDIKRLACQVIVACKRASILHKNLSFCKNT